MSETIATEKAVFEAADALAARGERVSVRKIQRAISGGSKDAIRRFLKLWKALREAIPLSAVEPKPLEDTVLASAKEMATRVREIARMEANGIVAAAATANAGQLAEAAAELESANLDCEEAEAELEIMTRERDHLAQDCAAATALNVQLEQRLAESMARTSAAELLEGELRTHAEHLKYELATSHRMHDEERGRSNQLRSEVTQIRIDLETNARALASAVGDATHARILAAEVKERTERAEATAANRIEAMAAECDQARRDAKEKGELAAGLQRELVVVKQKSDDFYALIKSRKPRIGKSVGKGAKSNVN